MQDVVMPGARMEPAESPPGDWFAIRVKSKCERCVAMALEGKGYRHFLPLFRDYRNWSNRVRRTERVLIPGYVFARFNPEKRLPILTIPAVVQIVGTPLGPLPIAAEEIAALQLIARSGSSAEPWPSAKVGQRIVVSGGPLRGLRASLVEAKNQYRAVVSVSLLGRSVAAEVDRKYVRPDFGLHTADSPWPTAVQISGYPRRTQPNHGTSGGDELVDGWPDAR